MSMNDRSNDFNPGPQTRPDTLRNWRWRAFGLGIALVIGGCGAENEGPADSGRESPASEGLETSTSGRVFEVRVEGVEVPTLTGAMIVGSSMGSLTNYLLNGSDGSARVQLRDVPLYETGEFPIDAFTIDHRATDMRCSYRSLTADEPLVLRMENAGEGLVRGSFSGEVECGSTTGDQARRPGTVSVSFTDDVD